MKIWLIVWLTMLLSIWPIKTWGSPAIFPQPQIVLIQKDEKASFSGALLPIDALRQLETKSLNSELYKAELEKNQQIIPLYSAPDHSILVLVGVGGLIIGFIIGFVAH